MENFAIIASPLQKAAAKSTRKFMMTEACMNSYNILREELKRKFLICPNFDKDFILDTDACLDGISGILSQEIEDASILRPVEKVNNKNETEMDKGSV